MLATWMRMKFPDQVTAAVASGAPILYFRHSVSSPEPIFYQWINRIYQEMGGLENGKCSALITEGLASLQMFGESTSNWPQIESLFSASC